METGKRSSSVLLHRWASRRDAVGRATTVPDSLRLDRVDAFPLHLVEEALSMLRAAHGLVENTVGADRLLLADVLHNTGCCLELLGRPVEALEGYMRSLRIRERAPDRSNYAKLRLAVTMQHVAMLMWLGGCGPERGNVDRLDEAAAVLAEVARTRREVLGPLSLEYSDALFHLALVEQDLERPRSGRRRLVECVRIREQALGPHAVPSRLAGLALRRCVA